MGYHGESGTQLPPRSVLKSNFPVGAIGKTGAECEFASSFCVRRLLTTSFLCSLVSVCIEKRWRDGWTPELCLTDRDGVGKMIPEELDKRKALLWNMMSVDVRLVSTWPLDLRPRHSRLRCVSRCRRTRTAR